MTASTVSQPSEGRARAVAIYRGALIGDRDAIGELGGHLASDVALLSPFARSIGVDDLLASLQNPMVAAMLASATWGEPVVDGDMITVEAALPATGVIGGLRFGFAFAADDRIERIEQDMLPPMALEPTAIKLTDEIREALNGAIDAGNPAIWSYIDSRGFPKSSLRGTTQVYSDDQLACWCRDRTEGMTAAIGDRPEVAVMYYHHATRTSYLFQGCARVEDDPAVCKTVYENSVEAEQNMDWRRNGVAVVVDLDRVEGRGLGGRLLMQR